MWNRFHVVGVSVVLQGCVASSAPSFDGPPRPVTDGPAVDARVTPPDDARVPSSADGRLPSSADARPASPDARPAPDGAPPPDVAPAPDLRPAADVRPAADLPPLADVPPAAAPCAFPATRVVAAATPDAILAAFAAAQPGDRIEIADGVHQRKNYALPRSGQPGKPIVVCGSRKAVLSARDGYALHVTGSHLVLSGFALTGGSKGLMLDGVSDSLLLGIEVSNTQEEGIHFRIHSARNVLRDSHVHDTGLGEAGYGEGVYVGSADSHWGDYTGGQPDRSDGNQILNNRIERTAAEPIDVKEGTTGGKIAGNILGGGKIAAANYADSFMDMKGNGWLVEGNRALVEGNARVLNGFEIHGKPNKVAVAPWGNDNVFRRNTVEGALPGVGFSVDPRTRGAVIACDNEAAAAAKGLADVTCQR